MSKPPLFLLSRAGALLLPAGGHRGVSWRQGCSLCVLLLALCAGTGDSRAAPAPAAPETVSPSPSDGAPASGSLKAPASGPGAAGDERAQITADELIHDKDLDVITARGSVEIQYAGRILLADSVNYQPSKDYATANGHVTVVEMDGSTMFAEHVELTDQMKSGFARQVHVLLKDGSQAAARQARRVEGQRTEMDHAVYSACDACSDDPGSERIWQIKAIKVIHDQQEKEISYYDARLEMFGVPVAYTPYLSHPDPSVKRKSGFLAPSYGGTSGLGVSLTTPYYYSLSPSQDFTFSPMFTTEQRVLLGGEYRLAGQKGQIVADGAITQDSDDRIRNYLKVKGRSDIDDTWRAGADVNLTSDDTFLRRYGYSSSAFLTSRPYLEGFTRRSYTSLEGYYFQDLRQTTTASTSNAPVVAPLAQWDYTSAPGAFGAWHTATLGAAILERDNSLGTDSRRLSASYGWHVPYTGRIGDVYRMDVGVRSDAYQVEDQKLEDGTYYTGVVGRVVPEAALTWSLPMGRQHKTYYEQIEPIIQGVVSTRGQNSDKIPNEDSLDFEFDDTNLFSTNRFTGFDRLEGGPRANYGINYTAYGQGNSRLNVLVGQTWHPVRDGLFSSESGLSEELSDYVGRIQFQPSDNVDLLYRFRLDKDNLEARRNELAARIGPPVLRLTAAYTSMTTGTLSESTLKNQEEGSFGLSSRLTRYWTVSADTRYDLGKDGGPLRVGGSARYDDECYTFTLGGAREYTYDRDYEDGYRISMRVVFKTLGEVNTSASP